MRERLIQAWNLLESRLGLRDWLKPLRGLKVGGGARWVHVPGSVLAGLLLVQVTTGVTLAFFYAPGTASAWASVNFLEEHVLLGSLLRGLHAFGAGAVVTLLALHLLQAGLRRAYQAPGEVVWLLGLLIVPVILGFALTGYLLPWDQKGYWATRVATGIMRSTPLVGGPVSRVFQGGPDLGSLTLTRFYALHTLILPVSLALVVSLHLRALLRRGLGDPGGEPTPYWPRQAARDALGWALVVGVIFTLAAVRGAGLEAPADPSSEYPPRPEWYFAPLRQLLMFVPEPWGSVVIPGLLAAALAALPWLDPPSRPRPRLARAILLVPALGALLLGGRAWLQDAYDPGYLASREVAEADAALARRLAREGGVPAAGPSELLSRYPPRWGQRLFELHCQKCHRVGGHGGEEAPVLTDYLSSVWLMGVIRDPGDPRFYGNTKLHGMDPLPREARGDLPALAAFLRSQDPEAPTQPAELVARGEQVFDDQECFSCHSLDPEDDTGLGPTLAGYGSEEWLLGFLRHPGHERYYGDDNDMPSYGKELSEPELRALVTYLRGLAGPPGSTP